MNVWSHLSTIFKQRNALQIAGLLALCVALITTLFFVAPSRAATGINQKLSFQGRLTNPTGGIIPDGYYNIQFKIYQDGSGTTAGNSGGTLEWTESYVNNGGTSGVQVRNGYFSVTLGSNNPFGSSVDWDQDTLWLSMNVAGTATACTTFGSAPCTADGEMLPMKRLTSTPYAMNAGRLGGLTAAQFIQNQNAGAQTTSNFWLSGTGRADSSLLTPTLDTATSVALNIGTTNATVINLNENVTVAATKTLTVTSGATSLTGATTGDALTVSNSTSSGNIAVFKDDATTVATIANGGAVTFQNQTNSTTAFQVQNALGTSNALVVDTANTRVGIGQVAAAQALEVNGSVLASNYRTNGAIVNNSSANNSRIQMSANGVVIDRNIADANPVLVVQNANASSTGNILQLQNSSATLATFSQSGAVLFKNSTNSATAFQVQNLANAAALVVDTTTNNVLIGGTLDTATATTLNIGTTNATAINLNQSVTVAAGKSLTIAGGNTASRPASPAEGMVYYDTTTDTLLTYANGKWQASRSTSTKIVAASNSSQSAKDAADYVADGTGDQTEINSALTAASGGLVYLMEGTYTVSAAISIPNNTTLAGAGAGTLITIPNSQNGTYSIITNTDTSTGTNVAIRDLRIDGNRANQASGSMHGLQLNGMGGGTGSSARVGGKVTNLQVRNMFGTSAHGIYLTNSSNGTLSNNVTQGNGDSGIILTTSSSNNAITGNTSMGNDYAGIYLNSSSNNSITGNTTQGNNHGILLSNTTSSTSVTGNTAQTNTGYGIYVNTSTNNTITGNVSQGNGSGGILLNATADTNTVSGNKVHDNGSTSGNNGIYLIDSSNNTVSGNDITDTSCTSTCSAIRISTAGSSRNHLSNNRHSSSGANASAILDIGTGTIYANQHDSSGNLINKSQGGGVTVGAGSATSSLSIQGGVTVTALPAPTLSATVTNVGTAGSTTHRYQITALDGLGETTGSTIQQTTTGHATLSGTNYNTITWTPVGGAYQYRIYRCSGAACTPALLATVAGNTSSYNDQANGSPSGAVPSGNTTGGATMAGSVASSTSLLAPLIDRATAGTLSIGTSAATFITLGSSGTVTTIPGTVIGNQSLTLNGTYTTTNNVRLAIQGTLNSSSTSAQYGIQNEVNFNPSGASLSDVYGFINVPTITGSALDIGNVYAGYNRISTSAGYTGQIINGYGLRIDAPTLSGAGGADGRKIRNYNGIYINGTSNGGNTANTINNYGIQLQGNSATAGAGGTLRNYGLHMTLSTGGSTGTTSNYGLYLTGNGGAASTNWAIYNDSAAGNYLQGNTSIGTSSNSGGYALNVQGSAAASTSVLTPAVDVASAGALTIGASTATSITIGKTGSNIATTVLGTAIFKPISGTDSTTAFQLQRADGTAMFIADSTNQTITIGGATDKTVISTSTGQITKFGGARNAKKITLVAEYTGSVLDAGSGSNNTGIMTSSIDLSNRMNYYKWTTSQGTNQNYDVVVQVPLPTDFDGWSGANPLSISTYTSNTTNGTITLEARDSGGNVRCNFVSVTPGSTSTWAANNSACTLSTGTYTAGDYMTLRIRMQSPTSGDVRIGNITLNYLSKY